MLKIALLAALVAVVVCQEKFIPPFLQKAPPAKQAEFDALLSTLNSKTDDVVEVEVKKWIAKQDQSIQSAFAEFQKFVSDQKAGEDAAHKAAISKFSPAAKQADAQIEAIVKDKSLTIQQRGEKLNAFMNSLPPAVKQEIETAMQG